MDEPIPMPMRPPAWQKVLEQAGRSCGRLAQKGQEKWQDALNLVRAARTPEGRERNLVPLMVAAAGAGLLLGLGLGWRRRWK